MSFRTLPTDWHPVICLVNHLWPVIAESALSSCLPLLLPSGAQFAFQSARRTRLLSTLLFILCLLFFFIVVRKYLTKILIIIITYRRKKGRFSFFFTVWGNTIDHSSEDMAAGIWSSWSRCVCSQVAERDESIQCGTPAHEMVVPTFRMGLPSSVNLFRNALTGTEICLLGDSKSH